MNRTRRSFLKASVLGAAGAPILLNSCRSGPLRTREAVSSDYARLDAALARPVLKRDLFPDPVVIDRLELLRYQDNFICRVTSTDGAEGLSVSNNDQMASLYPIFVNRLQDFFIGKDARDWEELLEEVYVFRSNYKLQNLALWVPLATIEFAVLDMLGKLAGKSMGKVCTPHISGSGLGYLYMMHFVSALPNAGPFHEFKGFSRDIPLEGPGSSISSYNGMVVVPTGPGLGMTIDPDFVAKHQEVD